MLGRVRFDGMPAQPLSTRGIQRGSPLHQPTQAAAIKTQTALFGNTCPAQAAAGSKHPHRKRNASNVPLRLTSACTLPCTIHRPWRLQPCRTRACRVHCSPARRRTHHDHTGKAENQAHSRRPNPTPLLFTPCACRSPPWEAVAHTERHLRSSSSPPNTLDTVQPLQPSLATATNPLNPPHNNEQSA